MLDHSKATLNSTDSTLPAIVPIAPIGNTNHISNKGPVNEETLPASSISGMFFQDNPDLNQNSASNCSDPSISSTSLEEAGAISVSDAAQSEIQRLIGTLLVMAAKRPPTIPQSDCTEGDGQSRSNVVSAPLEAAIDLFDEWHAKIHNSGRERLGGMGSPAESLILAATLARKLASGQAIPDGILPIDMPSTPSKADSNDCPTIPSSRSDSGVIAQAYWGIPDQVGSVTNQSPSKAYSGGLFRRDQEMQPNAEQVKISSLRLTLVRIRMVYSDDKLTLFIKFLSSPTSSNRLFEFLNFKTLTIHQAAEKWFHSINEQTNCFLQAFSSSDDEQPNSIEEDWTKGMHNYLRKGKYSIRPPHKSFRCHGNFHTYPEAPAILSLGPTHIIEWSQWQMLWKRCCTMFVGLASVRSQGREKHLD